MTVAKHIRAIIWGMYRILGIVNAPALMHGVVASVKGTSADISAYARI